MPAGDVDGARQGALLVLVGLAYVEHDRAGLTEQTERASREMFTQSGDVGREKQPSPRAFCGTNDVESGEYDGRLYR